MSWSLTEVMMLAVRGLLILAFLFFGWREIALLFRRPAKNMGTGLNRVWSVGRTTVLEAWAGRVWLLPILWLIAAFIMISSIRPFDESERMPLNIRMLLSSQEILLLVMMLVMACISLPRERERKIIITNASKPLSRLEIVLGKMLGFSLVAGLMILIMGILSLGILHFSNWRIMSAAAQSYELQQQDFNQKVAAGTKGEEIVPPSEGTKRLKEEGALFAYNYVSVRPHNLSIVGMIDLAKNPPIRLMKGGSSERAVYRFSPRLVVPEPTLAFPTGTRGYFEFYCPYQVYAPNPPARVQIRVVATRTDPRQTVPPKPIEKVITLDQAGLAVWEPNPDDGELYSGINEKGEVTVDAGPVTLEIQLVTPGTLMQVFDGADVDPATGFYPEDVPWNVVFRPVRRADAVQFPLKNPQMRGFERRGKQEIEGPKRSDIAVAGRIFVEQGVWRFSGQDLAKVQPGPDGNFDLGFILDTYKTDNLDATTEALIRVKSYDSLADDPFEIRIPVAEKRLSLVKVPAKYLGHSDPKRRGDMMVMIGCTTRDHAISMNEQSCRIELPQTPFALNLAKSEFVIFLEAVLLIGIAVTCSVRLGWPVAMLLTVACMLFGYFVDFILSLQEGSGLSQLNYRGGSGFAYHFFDAFTGGLWKVLGGIATFVPNFTIYRPQDYITNLQNMPIEVVASTVLWTVIFLAPFVGLAYLLIRKQELG
jgi:hypothetical protein